MTIPTLVSPETVDAFTRDLLANIGETTPEFIYAKNLKSEMIFANRAVLLALGKTWEEIRGRSDDQWHHDADEGQRFVENDARIMASGKAETLEEVLTSIDGPQTYLSTKSPLRDGNGHIIGLYGISINITAQKKAERFREMLLNELDHRVKNTLVLVQAMARQTFKDMSIDQHIWDAFEGRLISMSTAHDLLIRQSWVGADIADIITDGLKAHRGDTSDRFIIGGPAAWIDAQNALSLAMAFHELGTNAIKYGALSVPEGRVTISWQIVIHNNLPMLDLHWRESGGPVVQKPERKGFGSRLIRQAFAQNGNDLAEIEYLPAGVEFHVRVALGERLTKLI